MQAEKRLGVRYKLKLWETSNLIGFVLISRVGLALMQAWFLFMIER
jgi:hypothetical protein